MTDLQIMQAKSELLNQSFTKKFDAKKSKQKQSFCKKWTAAENVLYGRYLKTHMGQMNSQRKKKSGKFIKMSNFIGTKSESQCRSHHQKMFLTYKSIQNIMKYVNLVKKRGELICLEEFRLICPLDLQNCENIPRENKIQEEISTQRQSQEERKQQNSQRIQQEDCTLLSVNPFSSPIIQQQSKMIEIRRVQDEIFNVLNIEDYVNDQQSQFLIL